MTRVGRGSLVNLFNILFLLLCSVVADYFFVGLRSWTHGVDRWLSMVCTFHTVYRAYEYKLWSRFLFGCFVTLLTQYFARLSFARGPEYSNFWITFHTMWHISGGVICYLVHADVGALKEAESERIRKNK